ncbi:putative deaminase [Sulfitobacter noctilucicola]|uniref:tRNA(Arg) A34 adenosine deaminase TadA n=1 Tax=Sulfitobacter noctilucicola TaxID=1342301 RepID=A0A7W6M653_9RHOB|nr:nucleoside deaminase [Sulfitobacter noctilucicola]KIN62305.1 putative deaminase [Sulfitobacter noctilucicola]MBB4173160.1 tRNA(Arg) A34 adenosine deaminase TadA [Sulfitobacter noctilucicola]
MTGTVEPTALEREVMQSINAWAAEIGASEGKPSFTAAILHEGRELVRGRNTAKQDQDPTRHAEVVTIGKAAAALGTRRLKGCTLISSCQPCEMCLAAMRWAGIDRVIFGAEQEYIDDEMFRFPDLSLPQFHAACGGAFDYSGGVHAEMVNHLYRLDSPQSGNKE